jgi:sugar lactone lactonase YvrE
MRISILTLSAFSATLLFAVQTRVWTQGEASDYDKAILKNVSLRSDGRLSLAPTTRELFDSSAGYLWALATDSKGNLYTGGGTGAKLYRIGTDGKSRMMADFDALEIHAIAIDGKDRVYAATSPDGKIYRIEGNGKPAVFYDPKAKYIWAMVFDPKGVLYVATGDQGEIHRVTPEGKGSVFYRSEETHVRSLAMDRTGNLIAGTDPGGLVIRVSPSGDGFVLYQMAKREVTAVGVLADGTVYAAGVGNKVPSGGVPAPPPSQPPPTAPAQAGAGAPAARTATAPPPAAGPAAIGGSEVWRIDTAGGPRKMWSHPQDVAYAIAFDREGRALVGAGNKGSIYRIESPAMFTSLVTLPATQVTGFAAGAGGRLYAATGNTGKIYEIGPGIERTGSIESDILDAGGHTLWGRLSFEGDANGGQFSVSTRSGNLDQPQKGWSPWSAAITSAKGARVTSPAARFLQWKATLAGDGARSPELDSVDVAYLPKNLEPQIDEIEATPANYRFPAVTAMAATPGQTAPQTLVLPPIGKRAQGGSSAQVDSTPAMQYAKGYAGVRWSATDPNGDPLVFTVEIKGVNEREWKPLKDKVSERYLSWDSTAYPDGEYRVRVTATDAPGNPPGEALTARMESAPFVIDNTPPKITGLSGSRAGGKLIVKWHAADALNTISASDYSVDGGEWKFASPVTKLADGPELDYEVTIDAAGGEHTIAVRVEDAYGNQSVEKTVVR